ncbi:6-pyruvoyltetrahydropterin/6-carboxytetrahydropterin synthase [Halogranum rubrum]|uniref:6-pyruvoyltetrahydropterin/6-carboxytetrahydropterin synthase n=2 Tax=Halogranum rubrum TaxID=553466 RepID=A0A1I4ICC2_9EURY|nr:MULTISPECIES: 6-pyruvoyl tetrahydropterin synthase family protein [Halogranum]SFL51386.1 6-pyruvoyltetrahydropterin/6-carboxytetrahydropterin synthase [Halogranum rubrum]
MTQRTLGEPTEAGLAGTGARVLHIGRDRPIRISSGHRLMHHDGKCSRPHGHNYEISVRIVGDLTEEGWVVDKGEVTSVIDRWDHRFLLEEGDPLVEAFEASGDGDAVVLFEAPPTAEVMSVVLERRLAEELPDNVRDVSVQVSETSELCGGSF